jgi:hypothetical protein
MVASRPPAREHRTGKPAQQLEFGRSHHDLPLLPLARGLAAAGSTVGHLDSFPGHRSYRSRIARARGPPTPHRAARSFVHYQGPGRPGCSDLPEHRDAIGDAPLEEIGQPT